MDTVIHSKERVLRTLKELEAMVASVVDVNASEAKDLVAQIREEGRRERQEMKAMMLAFIMDEAVPISIYREWISRSSLYTHERAGAFTMTRKQGRVCLEPSVFFAFWRTLNEEKRSVGGGRHSISSRATS